MTTPKKTPIVIASDNSYKTRELQNLLAQETIPFLLQTELKVKAIQETGLTYVENAILKARNACEQTNLPAIADDSGLEVAALFNKPGIYSARYAGPLATDRDRIAKLLQEMREVQESERLARFQCVVVFLRARDDSTPIVCQGTWQGNITLAPQGNNGFGYEPIFGVPGYNCTAAELSLAIKNQISHRAQAVQKLIRVLKAELNA